MSFASTQDQCNQKNQCTYDDFSIPVRVRQDRIIVDGKTLFVNLGYLAEYSTFFATALNRMKSQSTSTTYL
uniref:BTB domain-containing protein n=1 Tax=Ditylenchus dipsaci TaxID=166011 RepID=A0A915EV16_9BILA